MRQTKARRWLAVLMALTLMLSLVPAGLAAGNQDPVYTLSSRSVSAKVGETATLPEVYLDDDTDNPVTTGINWTSTNENIAEIVTQGTGAGRVQRVRGVASGSTTLNVTITDSTGGTHSLPCTVTVSAATLEKIEVTLDKTEIADGFRFGDDEWLIITKVEAVWSDKNTSGENRKTDITKNTSLVWSAESSNPTVVSVPSALGWGIAPIRIHANGPMPGNSPITVTVSVTYNNVRGEAVCQVTVLNKTRVIITEYNTPVSEIQGSSIKMPTGSSKTLYAFVTENDTILDDDISSAISWSSSDETVVKAVKNRDGSVTLTSAANQGQAVITAAYTDQGGAAHESKVTCVVEASGGTGPDDPDNPGGDDPITTLPDGVTIEKITITSPDTDSITMDPGTQNISAAVTFRNSANASVSADVEWGRDGTATATYRSGRVAAPVKVTWSSSDADVANVGAGSNSNAKMGRITAQKPGEATITAKAGDKTASLTIKVRGFELEQETVTIEENATADLPVKAYGGAEVSELTCWSDDSTIAAYVNGKIEAYKPGTTRFTVSDPNRGFRANFDVTVKADSNATIDYGTLHAQTQKFLSFSDLLSSFRRQAGGKLSHITGVNMASAGGDLYYKYNSTTGAGTGVGAENYYHPYRAGGIPYGQRSLEDLTFVPKKGYAGLVTINYTGVSEDGKNYVCQLLVTVDPENGADAGISLTTPYNTALRLNGDDFNRICRERLGVKLDHVVFSQPPERQGTLYTDYVGPGNYGKAVSPNTRYSLKQLDNIWFVPAPGFSGTVTLYYTAYGTGTNAGSFAEQATITVRPENGVAIGGLTFDTVRGSAVRFDDERFNSYCRQVLQEEDWYDRQTLSRIRFDALPSTREGVLCYDYRSSSNTGAVVKTGTSYYYGTRDPRIDRLTFVPAADFVGTVKIPFTGWTSDGTSFTGNVEVNVRGGGGHGDILYVCAPGRSVSFRSSDFANLSRDLTDRTISYIIFRDLPASSAGSLYYNNSRVSTTGTRYQNSSIGRLSFRASGSFSGTVDIPFEGRSTSGEAFSGVVTISTSGSGSSGGSGGGASYGNIRYTSSGGAAVVFNRYDFDSLSQWETGRDVSSVRFQAPSSTWGDLYRNYRSSSNQGTRITSSASVTRSGLDQVAFVPLRGYSGTVYIDFTATSGNGSTFSGTVEIAVERGTWDVPTTVPTWFSDVASNAYYAEPVRWAVENGITSGTSSTTFSPSQTCTVAQILSFLYRANGSPQVTGSNPFTDVHTSDYYYEAALWAHQNGLVSGSALRPFAPCTRASTMEFMWKAAGSPAVSNNKRFDDVAASASYAQAVAWATEQKITSGTSKTTFSPGSICTRGQIVSFLYRAMGR